jgi:hypothetical protein
LSVGKNKPKELQTTDQNLASLPPIELIGMLNISRARLARSKDNNERARLFEQQIEIVRASFFDIEQIVAFARVFLCKSASAIKVGKFNHCPEHVRVKPKKIKKFCSSD